MTLEIHDAIQALHKFEYAARKAGQDRGFEYRQKLRELERADTATHVEAAKAFAELNGWKRTPSVFLPDQIGKCSKAYSWTTDGFLDHHVCYRIGRRNTAFLTQPYSGAAHIIDERRPWAASLGLAIHVPPDPLASFWFPGNTIFAVLTAAGTEVRWLPEQDGRLAGLWSRTQKKAMRE